MEQLIQLYIIVSILLFIFLAVKWSSKSTVDAFIKTLLITLIIIGVTIELRHFNLLH